MNLNKNINLLDSLEKFKIAKEFWVDKLSDDVNIISLVHDLNKNIGNKKNCYKTKLDKDIASKLIKMSKGQDVLIYSILLSVLNIEIFKYTCEEESIIGIPLFNKYIDDEKDYNKALLFKNRLNDELTFKKLILNVKNNLVQSYKNQYYPLQKIFQLINKDKDILDYCPISIAMLNINDKECINNIVYSNKNEIMICLERKQDEIFANLIYNHGLYYEKTIRNFWNKYINILKNGLGDFNKKISDIKWINEEERKKLLYTFNNTKLDYPKDKMIHQLFEEQVQRTPNNIAVVCKDKKLSYEELNEKSNSLARVLRKKGVKSDTIVGIMVERSLEMIIGIMAILKAGGAYLPIDSRYPEKRKKFIIEDSKINILLTQSRFKPNIKFDGNIVDLQNHELYKYDTENLSKIGSSNNLAYVIYTSGSTGNPKGVLIQHGSLVNRINWMQREYPIGIKDTILQKTTYTFDVSVWELLWWSLVGAKVCMLPPEEEKEPKKIVQAIKKYDITTMHFVPSMLDMFLEYIKNEEEGNDLKSLKQIFCSGEKLNTKQVMDFYNLISNGTRLINLYGPTEASIDVSYYECLKGKISSSVPIGKPIDNINLYILNNKLELQPIGVPGELCISGDGLARGYLNREDLTKEKFIENPFIPGERLYKTGDLARWVPDGNIEFLGRIDNQVKIRGFRIEIGEIENVLLAYGDIKESVVIDRKDKDSNKYLCAYLVSDKKLNMKKLRVYLLKELPDYMIPAYFVQLQKIPLTLNGKINRKVLPKPKVSVITAVYEAPRNEVEKIITEVWQKILGVEKIGINDNFFDLGGDSIKAIRVISKLKSFGYMLEVKDIFKYSNIKELSSNISYNKKVINQELVEGNIDLIPIQKWFFDNEFKDMHHFNQAVMLYRKEGFDKEIVQAIFKKIVQHHDALRMVYKKQNDKVIQFNRGLEGELYTLETFDYSKTEDYKDKINKKCNEIQSSIDLTKGPLVKLGLFKTKEGDHLLIAIHHLVVDGVSWRILFEDFALAYNQVLNGEEIVLQDKTNSYKEWSEYVKEYSQSKEIDKEAKYWNKVESIEVKSLPKDREIKDEEKVMKNCENVVMTLDEKDTENLLRNVNKAYSTEINDVLLTALGLTMKQWSGQDKVLVNLEGHGREKLNGDIDISRTIGWFTTQYPVIIDIPKLDVGYVIKNTKEMLRHIPNKGIGYGILKYLQKDKLKCNLKPQISFNYLGQFDEDVKNEISNFSKLNSGLTVSENSQSLYLFNINAVIVENKLNITFSYNKKEYDKGSIENLGEIFKKNLCNIIKHCVGKKETEYTPTDLGDNELTLQELEYLLDKYKEFKIKNIYRLTPMQEGMLFHTLKDVDSDGYFEQTILSAKGYIDINLYKNAFNKLLERYDILRTIFVYEGVRQPKQIVFDNRKARIYYEDISKMNNKDKNKYVDEFIHKDKKKGFNLNKDLLIRVSILKIDEGIYKIIWSFHHILMDGWCLSVIMNDFFKIYSCLNNNEKIDLPEVTPYIEYIKWMEKQDKENAKIYWKEYLESYDTKAEVVKKNKVSDKYKLKKLQFIIDEQKTDKLNNIGKSAQVTVNTVIQAIWGILLQKRNNTNDVVFGSVVSGRNAEVKDIEKMVGLFINTIPVRITSEKSKTFIELIKKVQKQSLISTKYDYYPLAEIQANTTIKQDLIDNILIFENYYMDDHLKNINAEKQVGFSIKDINMCEQTNYNFNIAVIPGSELKIILSYNEELYENRSISIISKQFEKIVQQIVQNPQLKLDEIEIITEEEKNKILYEFNNTKVDYPKNKTIHELFEEQVEKNRDNIAVVYEDKKLTYKELNEKANSLAAILREKGVRQDSIVGIMVERSVEMIVGIIAILKAGGAYLPIDSKYPKNRIEYMLEDSKTNIILTEESLINTINEIKFDGQVVNIQNDEIYKENTENFKNISNNNDLAYVIYTSGSTGKPKGVMIEHKNVINLVNALEKSIYSKYEGNLKVALVASYVFDASVQQIFATLLLGNSLYIVPNEVRMSGNELIKYYEKNSIDVSDGTPLHIQMLLTDESCSIKDLKVKNFIIGGEELNKKTIEDFYCNVDNKNIVITNVYGPTECCVDSTAYNITDDNKDMAEKIPIGKPLMNEKIYILGKNNELQPIGVQGELCISGEGVSRGYLNKSNLTREKFIKNPLNNKERMYRTGDLARWLPDGNIEFLGRIDNQVKIRGFRIELGEIKNQLLKYTDIKEAVVIDIKDNNNEYLCAYIVGNKELNVKELRECLSKELPQYMIPAYFMQLEKIPITINGKIDRKALPKPNGNINIGTKYEAPRNEVERKLVEIWKEILGVEKIGINDNFFDLGGHSLKVTVLVSKIHKTLNVQIPMKYIFEAPTIKEISKYIEDAEKNLYTSIDKVEKSEYYETSSAQKRIYTLQQLDLESTAYNMPLAFKLEGNVDKLKIENVFKKLIKRHDALRTHFDIVNNEVVQKIDDEVDFNIEYIDGYYDEYAAITNENVKFKNKDINYISMMNIKKLAYQFMKSFNLTKAPLFRVMLIKISQKKYIIMIDIHHIISDGMSMSIITKELCDLYEEKELKPLRIQYKDFAVWQNKLLKSEKMKKQEKYWLERFSGEIPVLNMPYDYERPTVQSFEGDSINFEVDKKITKGLRELAKQTGTTMYMILLSAYNILLSKYSGQEDVIVGSPIAGRHHEDLNNVIGMFVNTLAIRNYPKGDKSYIEFLKEVKENALKAYENQDYQFEGLVNKLNLKRDMSRNALFDVMFVMQNMDMNKIDIEDFKLKPYETEKKISKFDLTLCCIESDSTIYLEFEYCTKLFNKKTIQRMINHYTKILNSIIENKQIKLNEIGIITEEEKNKILYEFNDTKAYYPKDKTIYELFEEQVEKTPDNIAVVYEDKKLTYKELNEKANSLATVLREKGVKPNTIVGIMVERSLEMIIGIMGILKSGGAYLPIDTKYPNERIEYMLKDSKSKILLSTSSLLSNVVFDGEFIDLLDEQLLKCYSENLEKISNSNVTAYIIYTSGTTGRPKGVSICHNNIVNTICWRRKYYNFDEEDSVLQIPSFGFDSSVEDILTPLISGSRLVIINQNKKLDVNYLRETIIRNKVTNFLVTPAFYNTLLDNCLVGIKTLKKVTVAGENVHQEIIRKHFKLFKDVKLFNEYGPTENSVCSTIYEFNSKSKKVLIGKPISNTQVYILDRFMDVLPIGVPGELCLAGYGLARGYLNRPDLTTEKFVDNPFKSGQKMYRTGDLARCLADGNIEFLGRIDDQVKIRGFRIELGEIEAQLLKHKDIKNVVVIDRQDNKNNKYLCAYIVSNNKLTVKELKEHLSKKLPQYMIPAYFMELEKIPITLNGKVNKKALPEPNGNINTGTKYEAPGNEVEKTLIEIWQEILGIDKIGINDNFFDLGGHSLNATILVMKIKEKFNINYPLGNVFNNSNIKSIAQYIINNKSDKIVDNIMLMKKGTIKEKNFFVIHTMTGEVEVYNRFINLINKDFNCWGIRMKKLESYAPVNLDLKKLAKDYVLKIKSIQSTGPYYVSGWSFAGVLAFEIVRQLEEQGDKVEFLGLYDTSPLDIDESDKYLSNINSYTKKNECDLLNNIIPNNDFEKIFEKFDELQDIWNEVVCEVENSSNYKKQLYNCFASKEGIEFRKLIGNSDNLKTRELIYYFNLLRSFKLALSKYKVENKINADINYFAASTSKNKKDWETLTHGKYNHYIVQGNHYSIVQGEDVINLTKILNDIL